MPVLLRALCLAGLAICGAGAGFAQPVEVDLQLVLAVDVSRSMDVDEQRLQREGYVEAFRHPAVIKAIHAGVIGRIAVTYVQWAGAGLQEVVVPWSLVDGVESAAAFADRLAAEPLIAWRRTSISGGLDFGAGLFERSGFRSEPRVIDISGDGPNNAGRMVTLARDQAVARGIVINGLPVMLKTGRGISFFDIDRLDRYYEDCVIGGFGAFIVTVREAAEFAQAIRRKLILEIAGARPRLVPAQAPVPAPDGRADCLIGEKLWQEFMRGRE